MEGLQEHIENFANEMRAVHDQIGSTDGRKRKATDVNDANISELLEPSTKLIKVSLSQ